MKKEQFEVISEALTWLHGEKLHKAMRAGSMGDFGFGDLVKREGYGYDDFEKCVVFQDLHCMLPQAFG